MATWRLFTELPVEESLPLHHSLMHIETDPFLKVYANTQRSTSHPSLTYAPIEPICFHEPHTHIS